MKWINYNHNWEFINGEPSNFPMMKQEKEIVSLPHDFMIKNDVSKDSIGGSDIGYYVGGIGSYTKYLELFKEDLKDKHLLYVEACFGSCKVIVNGHILKRHHYGYTPFIVDLNPVLKPGNNRITITVMNSNLPNSRWYSGSGLYRNVYLLNSKKTYIVPDGIFVKTIKVDNNQALINVKVKICNEDSNIISDKLIINIKEKDNDKSIISKELLFDIKENETKVLETDINISDVKLWDIDNPNLYTIEASINEDNDNSIFGIRTIQINPDEGFILNGKSIILKGGCLHHDNGILGACAYKDSEYRKIKLHKDNGYNAIRCAHNPPSKYLLDACDELGMLVIDEAFDVWNMEKNTYDFSQYFQAQWQDELLAMINKDYNHPSIFMWSIGNELPEQGGLSNGYETSNKLTSYVKSLDDSRFVGGSLSSFFRGLDDEDNAKHWESIMENIEELQKNGMVNLDSPFGRDIWDEKTSEFVKNWDIVGYNYLNYQYEPSHLKHPDRVMIATESKIREVIPYWQDVERLPYLIGDFTWTSMDYLGEAGIGRTFYVDQDELANTMQRMHFATYPCRSAGAGDFDLCGFEKPQLHLRQIVWGSKQTYIVVNNPNNYNKIEILGRYGFRDCIHSYSFDLEENAPIKIDVFSGGKEVELYINDQLIGREKVNDYIASFDIKYHKGSIKAISYDDNNEIISQDILTSYNKPSKISARCDKEKLINDGDSLMYITIEITDDDGNYIPYADDKLIATYQGEGSLIGFGSANPTTEENYTKGEFTTYQARAMAIIRSSLNKGEGILKISSEKYNDIELKIIID